MKLLKSILLIGSVILVSAACQREVAAPAEGPSETVTFNVSLPADALTKATGDGSQIDRLRFWKFNLEDEEDFFYKEYAVNNGSVNVEVNMTRGVHYTLCFWAEKAVPDNESPFFVSNNAVIQVYYQMMVNQDRCDCFSATLQDFTLEGSSQAVVLRRPFAQLNVGLSYADTTAAGLQGIHADKFKTRLEFEAPNMLDLKTGTVSGEQDILNIVSYSDAPWDALVEVTEGGAIDPEKSYTRASFCYILADDTHDQLETVFFEMFGNAGGIPYSITKMFNNVPLCVNQQTNILGEVLSN